MNCLVTGGAGFIGTNLIKKLLDDGHKVFSIDNYSTGRKENEQDGCRYFNLDLQTSSLHIDEMCIVTGIDKLDVIFHLAAEVASIDYSFENPYETLKTNIDGTMKICDYARKNDVRVVLASSCAVTDGEDLNVYSYSKAKAEDICNFYNHFFNLGIGIVRFANVYGYNQRTEGPYRSVISIFDECYLNEEPLPIRGDGNQTRDFIDVRDICRGLIKISNESSGTYRLGTGSSISINDIAEMYGLPTYNVPSREGESEVSQTDLSKNSFEFKTKHTIKEWIDNLK